MLFCDFMERWERNPDNLEPKLIKWLNRITLMNRDELEEDDAGKVNLMTIHASKGLEFDVVFLPGVEDGIIPHERAVTEDPKNIEEERRLFYVAITRARKMLYISSCRNRRQRLDTMEMVPSPFLKEIPDDLMEPVEMENEVEDYEEAKEYFSRMPWNKS